MLKSTLHHVTTDNLTQIYRYDASSSSAAARSQKYSAVTYGSESARVNHFVQQYSAYFQDYYSLSASRLTMHPRAMKASIDRHIQDHVYQGELTCSLRQVIIHKAPNIETVAFWLEAGAVPDEQTLIDAIERKQPLKTLQLLLEHAKCSSEAVISAMNNRYDLPAIELLIKHTLKDVGVLSPRILTAAINNHIKMIQYLLKIGVPPSKEAVCAAIKEGYDLKVIEFVLNAYEKYSANHTPAEKSQDINYILNDCISKKIFPEVLALLENHGAQTSSEIVKTALLNRQPPDIIKLLLEKLSTNEKNPPLNDILNYAARIGHNAEVLSLIMGFGATPSSETLDLILSRPISPKVAEPNAIRNIELILKSAEPTDTTLVLALSNFQPSPETIKTVQMIIDKVPSCTNKSLDLAFEKEWPFDPVIKTLLGKGIVASLENLHTAIKKGYSIDDVKALSVKPTEETFRILASQKNPPIKLAHWMLESEVKLTYDIIKASVSGRCETIDGKKPKVSFANLLLNYNFDGGLFSGKKVEKINLYDDVLYAAIIGGFPSETISLILVCMTDKNGPSLASLKAARDRDGDAPGMYGIVSRKSNEVYGDGHLRRLADSKGLGWWPKHSPYGD